MVFSNASVGRLLASAKSKAKKIIDRFGALGQMPVFWGRCPSHYASPAWILLPYAPHRLNCGLAGLISIKHGKAPDGVHDAATFKKTCETIRNSTLTQCMDNHLSVPNEYLGGDRLLAQLYTQACNLKQEGPFISFFGQEQQQAQKSL